MAIYLSFPMFRATRDDGTPGNGWKLYSYAAGSSTPKDTYVDQAKSAANTNPVIMNGAGEAPVFLDGAYKLTLTDENDVVQWAIDGIGATEDLSVDDLDVAGDLNVAGGAVVEGQIESNVTTGTAPIDVASTTMCPNLNAAKLKGKEWATPDPIGATTPATGKFTTLEATGAVTARGGVVIADGSNQIMQTANGGTWEHRQNGEEITLNTGGTTTDSSGDLLPADSIIEAVVARVTESITVATNWALGDAATSARFLTATTDLTVGTKKVGMNHWKGSVGTDAAGPTQASAAKLRVTTTGTPSAGKIRVAVFYRTLTGPTS